MVAPPRRAERGRRPVRPGRRRWWRSPSTTRGPATPGPLYASTAPAAASPSTGRSTAGAGSTMPYDDDDRLPERWARPTRATAVVRGRHGAGGRRPSRSTARARCSPPSSACCTPTATRDLTRAQIEAGLGQHLGATEVVWMPLRAWSTTTAPTATSTTSPPSPGPVSCWSAGLRRPGRARPRPPGRRPALRPRPRRRRRASAGRWWRSRCCRSSSVGGERLAVPYVNLYVCNGGVIVPVTGHPADDDMLALIGEQLPGSRGRAGARRGAGPRRRRGPLHHPADPRPCPGDRGRARVGMRTPCT